jgi:xanthine dehydrogenase YagS FAD-binding subunit
MQPCSYARPGTVDEAIALVATTPGATFLAGGTSLVDVLRIGSAWASLLVDISALPLNAIEPLGEGVRIGALASMSTVAEHPLVTDRLPLLREALLAGASPQLRNQATMGGNLLQRTRCAYFRDPAFACNRREPGSGCAALAGEHRTHAIVGTSDQCIATHPSDLAVALLALDAVVQTKGPHGARALPLAALHLPPGETPAREHVLEPGELIVAIDIPAPFGQAHTHYLKLRDRASYAFALVSVAVALDLDPQQEIVYGARIALGGVGTIPYRANAAEIHLVGQPWSATTREMAAMAALTDAQLRPDNRFKLPLARHTIVRALEIARGLL